MQAMQDVSLYLQVPVVCPTCFKSTTAAALALALVLAAESSPQSRKVVVD